MKQSVSFLGTRRHTTSTACRVSHHRKYWLRFGHGETSRVNCWNISKTCELVYYHYYNHDESSIHHRHGESLIHHWYGESSIHHRYGESLIHHWYGESLIHHRYGESLIHHRYGESLIHHWLATMTMSHWCIISATYSISWVVAWRLMWCVDNTSALSLDVMFLNQQSNKLLFYRSIIIHGMVFCWHLGTPVWTS